VSNDLKALRDSKQPGPTLGIGRASLAAFVDQVKSL
jgi:hypothetical protein